MGRFKRPRERQESEALQDKAGRAAFQEALRRYIRLDPIAAAQYSSRLLIRKATMDDLLKELAAAERRRGQTPD